MSNLTSNGPENIHVDDKPLYNTVDLHLKESTISISIGNNFNKDSKKIKFVSQIEEICFKIFDAITQIKINNGSKLDAALLGTNLYQSFTSYWNVLLSKGQDVLGIQLWKNVLSITHKWEEANKPITIHKGTPCFFLAENYLLVGDRDLGFQYLYSALLDDINLAADVQSFNYPACAPSYLTITMRANKDNHLYPLVDQLRKHLDKYIFAYNQEYSKSFTISDFDSKFLENKYLKDIVSYFVLNFLYLFESNRSTIDKSNEILKLRNLDLIFNICLIIDKTLEQAKKNHACVRHPLYFSDGIKWISQRRSWMNEADLTSLWGENNLDLNNSNPDDVIPRLLLKNEYFKNKAVKQEIHDLLVAYKFRNYGGHNIKQQNCLTDKFEDIIQALFSSLFISIESL
jgi:hypothetical protein